MTCEAGSARERGTAPAVPRPGSVTNAAMRALIEFAKEERATGAVIAHDSFDGILAEHALALEEARDMLRETLAACTPETFPHTIERAATLVDDQIQYIRALGGVAGPATDQEDETDG